MNTETPEETVDHRRTVRAIEDHFAGRGSRHSEAALRAHMPGCERCRREYDRQLVVARLDPRAVSAEERIARGLGFGGGRRVGRRLWLAGLLPAAALGVWFLMPTTAYRARGSSGAPGAGFWIYRVDGAGHPRLIEGGIPRDAELAFAYSNLPGRPYLMIFGVDEHRHVYWFHPAWPSGQPPPRALRTSTGPGPFELPEAIRQALDGRTLDVYALFADRALLATDVERTLAREPPSQALSALLPGVRVLERTLRVEP